MEKIILSYRNQTLDYISVKHANIPVKFIGKREWLNLIHFQESDIQSMGRFEKERRISALRSIEEAPHFNFNLNESTNPMYQSFAEKVRNELLNGLAHYLIHKLETTS